MDDRWWIEHGRVGCDEAVGDGKSKGCLMLAELKLDMCWDWHPCSSPVGFSLLQFPICYSCIIFGIIFMPFCCPWCHRVLGWVSTQPNFIYPSDILQGSSHWACLSLSLVNHFLWLILRVQSLYSLIGYWIVQFQCTAIVHHCLFFLCCPILDSFLNFALSAFRTFLFC